ncbi:YhgE/Pip domain-containing protein [Sediminibacillus dalangtanensis]|uniref:YhgE/Pip domain-containing protein n=1 Tax=Sediminibacillus dalangtanensis TaxID=2729421 RepID=A0ABX7VPL8_9BACI|nr:YhgE/Pip domain-containing protein [Sediminibacillus dalangtanensis]QTM98418.1 YhgE/Pip domain-containing protein [Sediminibacillus dalangtanensis]
MRRIKKLLLVFTIILLAMPSLLVSAASDSKSGEDTTREKGKVSSKDEVIYGKLNAAGKRQELYVVNTLDVEKAGKVVDHGTYTDLKNLTDLSPLEQKDGEVTIDAPEGKFYYQGNMEGQSLPWDISITYLLDGKEIAPADLAGKDGHVEIKIATSANEKVDPVFFENYLLQVSLSLNLDNYRNIKATDGTLANAGKNKQVSFTVMPEKEEELVVEADVTDFELDGIDISAVPSSMPIESPDIDEMTGEMDTLTDAIAEVNGGVADLEDGIAQLNDGAGELRDGSMQYKDGISSLAGSSAELVNGSGSLKQALEQMSASLESGSEDMGLGDLKQLEDGLSQMADGINQSADGLVTLKDNYAKAYSTLDEKMAAIPDYELSEEEFKQLYKSGANPEVLDKLKETYTAARTAKGTYSAVKEGFDAVGGTLGQVSGSLTDMADNLEEMANQLASSRENMDSADSFAQLQDGIREIASQYASFHSGLVEYTDGVNQLSSSYGELDNGISGLAEGLGETESGVGSLHDGTAELQEATSDLPDEMKKEVNEMMDEYDKSDFEPVSFVSPENEHINSVQFVLKTESIKQEEQEETEESVEEEKGFWDRLMDLFK